MKIISKLMQVSLLLLFYCSLNAQSKASKPKSRNKVNWVHKEIVYPVAKSEIKLLGKEFYRIASQWDSISLCQGKQTGDWQIYLNLGDEFGELRYPSRLIVNLPGYSENEETQIGINDFSMIHAGFITGEKQFYYMNIPASQRLLGDALISVYTEGYFKKLTQKGQALLAITKKDKPLFRQLNRAEYLKVLIQAIGEKRAIDSLETLSLLPSHSVSEKKDQNQISDRISSLMPMKDSGFIQKMILANYQSDADYAKKELDKRLAWTDIFREKVEALLVYSPPDSLNLPAQVNTSLLRFDGFKDNLPGAKYVVEMLPDPKRGEFPSMEFITVLLPWQDEKSPKPNLFEPTDEHLSMLANFINPIPKPLTVSK